MSVNGDGSKPEKHTKEFERAREREIEIERERESETYRETDGHID